MSSPLTPPPWAAPWSLPAQLAANGQDSRFRRSEDVGLFYVTAVPESQQIHDPRIDYLIGQAPPEAWQRHSCGAAPKATSRHPAAGCLGDGDESIRQRRMLARRSVIAAADRRAQHRLAVLCHAEEAGNSLTCRYYGISRTCIYEWQPAP